MDESPYGAGLQPAEVIAARPVSAPSPAERRRLAGLETVPRRNGALDLVLLLAVALVFPFGFELIAQLAVGEALELAVDARLITVRKWFDALLLVVLAAYFVHRNRVPAAAFGLRTDSLGRQGLWGFTTLLAAYAAFVPIMLLILGLVTAYPDLEQDLLQRTRFMQMLPLNDLVTIVVLLVPVAIHEELLFRALLIPYLHRVGCSWTLAVLISSAIFASLHFPQGWLGVVQIFGVGLVLGLFFVLSRSALAVIVAHFSFDLIQSLLARVLLPWLEHYAPQ